MPDKRSFEEMNSGENSKPIKRRRFNHNDNFKDILRKEAEKLNSIYLKLLKHINNHKKYRYYENKYRNEEYDIVSMLKNDAVSHQR